MIAISEAQHAVLLGMTYSKGALSAGIRREAFCAVSLILRTV